MRRKGRALFLGIAAAAFLGMLMQTVIAQHIGPPAEQSLREVLGAERYEEILREATIRRGSAEGMRRIAQNTGREVEEAFRKMDPARREAVLSSVLGSVAEALPVVLSFLVLLLLLAAWERAFFLQGALTPGTNTGELLHRATRSFPRLLAVWVVAGFLSGIWLPFAFLPLALFSPVFAIPFLLSWVPFVFAAPRLALSPVLALRDGGILQPVRESWRRSRGRWGKIVGNMIVAALAASACVWLALLILQGIASLVTTPSIASVFVWIQAMAVLGGAAYRTIFLAQLTEGLGQRPTVASR